MSEGVTSWQAVRAGLDEYRPKELIVRLAELFQKGVPTENGPAREAVIQRTLEVVESHAGGWYRASPVRLGDEIFNGYCWCHSFFGRGAQGPGAGVAANIDRILAVLGSAHGWVRALAAHVRPLRRPGDDEPAVRARLAGAVREVVELTAQATDCNEMWYHYARSAILWLVEAQGLELTDAVRQAVEAATAAFESWVGPTPDQARAAADEVAFAVVREELRRRYGAG